MTFAKRAVYIVLIVSLFLLSACQPTPEEEAIIGKNDDISESIVSQSGPEQSEEEVQKNRFQLKKTYKNGNVLSVDAAIINSPEKMSTFPVLEISEKILETPEEIEAFVRTLYPTETIYTCMMQKRMHR